MRAIHVILHAETEFGDFDGDGYLDLAIGNSATKHYLFRNDGIGGFTKITGPASSPINDGGQDMKVTQYMKPHFGDLEGDGLVDMFFGMNFYSNSVTKQPTTLGYDLVRVTTGDAVSDSVYGRSAYWVDVNNDGWLDLFVTVRNDPNLATDGFSNLLYINNQGTLTKDTTSALATAKMAADSSNVAGIDAGGACNAAFADYDRDGLLDVAIGVCSSHSKGMTFGDGGGVGTGRRRLSEEKPDRRKLQDEPPPTPPPPPDRPNLFFRNNGGGSWTQISLPGGPGDTSVQKDTRDVDWADVDGDGDLDLLYTNMDGASDLYLNNGNGTFTKESSTLKFPFLDASLISTLGAAFADVDNDGDLDLLVISGQKHPPLETVCQCYDSNQPFIGETCEFKMDVSSPDGGITMVYTRIPNPRGAFGSSMTPCNTMTDDYRHRMYQNNGDGTFTEMSQFGSQLTPGDPDNPVCQASGEGCGMGRDVDFGDYDGDGLVDVLITNYYANMNLYKNRGNFLFELQTHDSVGPVASDLTKGEVDASFLDFNGDGHLDIFHPRAQYAPLLSEPATWQMRAAVYLNDGKGKFEKITEGNLADNTDNVNGHAWGDVNNDGKLDLFMTVGIQGASGEPTADVLYTWTSCGINSGGVPLGETAVATQCISCPGASRKIGDRCVECPQHVIMGGDGQCSFNCPPGTVRPYGGVSCTSCPIGTAFEVATSTCNDCGRGKYTALAGSLSCTSCSVGEFQAATGQNTCEACPAGKYMSGAGASACVDCPTGSWCGVGASSPTQCAAGTFGNQTNMPSAESCFSCPAGGYCPRGSVQPTRCAPGTFSNTSGLGECYQCEAGTRQPASGGTSCLPCLLGMFCPVSTAVPQACPAGTYGPTQDIKAAEECPACPRGRSCGVGTQVPVPCFPGTFSNMTGLSACWNCEAGKRMPNTGAQACLSCLSGMYCSEGTAVPTSCPAGTYSASTDLKDASECTECPAGSSCPSGSAAYIPCRPGTFANTSGLGECFDCAPGTYADTSGNSACALCGAGSRGGYCTGGNTAPTTCPAGFMQSVYENKDRLSSVDDCTACTSGFYCPGTGKAIECAPGQYSDVPLAGRFNLVGGSYVRLSGATACASCPVGKYSNQRMPGRSTYSLQREFGGLCNPYDADVTGCTLSGVTKCCNNEALSGQECGWTSWTEPLVANSVSSWPVHTDVTDCDAGVLSRWVCSNCEAGKYAPSVGTASCLSCPAGKFSGKAASDCSQCPLGSFSAFEGSSSCTPCPLGGYCASAGSASAAAAFTPCPAGTWNDQFGRTSLADCNACPVGKSSPLPESVNSTVCTPCIPGSYANIPGKDSCTRCEPGKYQDQSEATSCKACTDGYYCVEGSAAPQPCPGGRFRNASLAVMTSVDQCLICGTGTFCPVGSATETLCAPGTYNPLAEQSTCTNCEPGKFQDQAGSTACKSCTEGYYCAQGAAAALPCRGGTHMNASLAVMTSADQCVVCPAGTSCSVGSAQPSACLPGSFSATAEADSCVLCPEGKYTSTSGNTACEDCTPGYLCVRGASAPQPCRGGTHANQTVLNITGYLSNLDQCVVCPAGTSCSVGSAEPSPCLPGSFSAASEAQACTLCSAGEYQNLYGQTACKTCVPGFYCQAGAATPVPCEGGPMETVPG